MALAAPRTTLAPPQGGAALHGSQAPDLSDILAAADRIDPLPVSVTRLALLVGDANADIREIVEVITYDQSLAANLLRQVNSAALGGRVKITTVHDAVMRLGIGTLFTLALGASVRTAMGQAIPLFGLAEGELWRHSVAASLAADVLRSRSPRAVPMEASTAALLHDFGKLVMAKHFGAPLLDRVAAAAANEGMTRLEAEKSVFGFTHAEVGGVVSERWNLPLAVVDGIRDHHRCDDDMSVVSRVVALSDVIADDMFVDELDPLLWDLRDAHMHGLRIDADTYPNVLATATEQYAQLAARYGVN